MEDENKQLPIEELIGKLLQDQAVLTYQLTTAIAAKLLVSNEVGGGIKTVATGYGPIPAASVAKGTVAAALSVGVDSSSTGAQAVKRTIIGKRTRSLEILLFIELTILVNIQYSQKKRSHPTGWLLIQLLLGVKETTG